jgi:AcrR family transcriptional regulator
MTFTAKGLATRNRIIEGAATRLRSDEPGTVTLDDVRAWTGTSKSQLFHYFPGGKEELLLEVARHEADRVLEDQQPHLAALNSWASWDRWQGAVIARYRAQGARCPLASLMNQVDSVPGASQVATSLLNRWQEYIRQGITTMQAQGDIDPELNAQRTAAAFIAGIQGGVTVLRSTGDTAHLEAIFDLLTSYLRATEHKGAAFRR